MGLFDDDNDSPISSSLIDGQTTTTWRNVLDQLAGRSARGGFDDLPSFIQACPIVYDAIESYLAHFVPIHGAEFEDGSIEEHHSSLQAFGDNNTMSAMCKTVGFTAAVATELILSGDLDELNGGLYLPKRNDKSTCQYWNLSNKKALYLKRDAKFNTFLLHAK
eukprot:scaffold9279_cov68-Cylindrotheca_fusiformis.AAC.1